MVSSYPSALNLQDGLEQTTYCLNILPPFNKVIMDNNLSQAINHDFHPFIFDQVRLKEACWINGVPYFTRRAIGEFLGYATPKQSIRKIIERNPYIDDDRWSVVVKLTTTDGKEYWTRVYNPIGLQLIMFESRQPKARFYKVAVAHFVYAFTRGEVSAPRNIASHNLYL